MPDQSTKKQRTHPQYELLYHPGIPGRGEFIRLAFEAAGVSYTDIAVENKNGGYKTVQAICMNDGPESAEGNAPVFAPPALRVPGEGKDGSALIIGQTPNILNYLGDKLGVVPEDEAGKFYVHQLALTALDLNNEVHDSHHPIAVGLYYEDQKEEAKRRSKDVRENRIPKFLQYFDRTLKWNAKDGKNKYLVGSKLSYADLTVWQVLDGLMFSFPKQMEELKSRFPDVFGTFYESVKSESGVKEYLGSERRQPYSMGVFRYYPELDKQ
ncbi:hypothetical protein MBLNU230_g0182t1 [Neophaeotheca triangularis]